MNGYGYVPIKRFIKTGCRKKLAHRPQFATPELDDPRCPAAHGSRRWSLCGLLQPWAPWQGPATFRRPYIDRQGDDLSNSCFRHLQAPSPAAHEKAGPCHPRRKETLAALGRNGGCHSSCRIPRLLQRLSSLPGPAQACGRAALS